MTNTQIIINTLKARGMTDEQLSQLLDAYKGDFPAVDSQSLAENYQGLAQAVAQVFHTTDERARKLED